MILMFTWTFDYCKICSTDNMRYLKVDTTCSFLIEVLPLSMYNDIRQHLVREQYRHRSYSKIVL